MIARILFSFSFLVFAQNTQQMTLEQMRRDLARVTKSISETKAKIQTVRDARFLPDLYFALADFYVEKSRYMYAIKIAENPKKSPEDMDFTSERRAKDQAIEVYETLIEKFPKLPDRDKAYFFKAHEQRELGRLEDMIKTDAQLTKEYPESEFWSETQLTMGDYFFEDKKEFDIAIEAFQRILARPPGPFTPLAHYKLGWCFINKNDFKKALLEFEKAITENRDVDTKKIPEIYRKTDVRRDALLALVWPYSELSAKDLQGLGSDNRLNPLGYFSQLSPDAVSYERVLEKLGSRFFIKQRLVEATQVYFELLRITKDLNTRIDVIERLYLALKTSHKDWPVHGLVQEIAKSYPLVKGNKKYVHDWEIYARDIATRTQKRAKETRDKADWDWAIRDYESYLSVFGSSKFALAMRLNLAESYFATGKSVEAARAYEELARKTTDKTKKKDALDSAIQSYITALRNQSELSRLQLTEVRFGLREVGRDFIKQNPNDKACEDVRLNIAQTYYDERDFKNAVKSFKEFINLYPQSTHQEVVANLILDSYNQREDYKGLVREGNELLKNKNIREPTLREQLQQIVQQAEMRSVQLQAGEYGSPDYTANLLKLARKYKGSSMGDQALYEAFSAQKAKHDPKAYESGEQLLLQHAKSKYAQEVVTAMGQMALGTADFRRAALYFELYYDRYSNQADAKDLLKHAAQIRELLGDFKMAARDNQKLGNDDQVAQQDFLAGDWASLLRSSARASSLNSGYYEGVAQYRLHGLGPARASLEKVAAAKTSTFDDQEKAAHALYLLSMGAMSAYQQIQLKAGQEVKNVQEKAGFLKDLDSKLKKVIAYGNGRWTIAALYGLGQANGEFAAFIRKAPLPDGLSPDQQKQFRSAIETQAKTYDSMAQSFFEQCISSAEKFEIFTGFAIGCQSRGQIKVDEAQETKIIARASDSSPTGVNEIRQKLFDQPRQVDLLLALADVYLKSQDYAMAELIYQRASEIDPQNGHILACIGVTKLFKNELMEAKTWFDKAMALSPKDALAYWGLAGLYNQFHFFEKLKPALVKAKVAGPLHGPVHPFIEKVFQR